ncbi:hypothetical protein ACP70R_015024 [Stipagrostis hirtigluma subsp. patula]
MFQNFFNVEPLAYVPSDDKQVALDRPGQKPLWECAPLLGRPVDCSTNVCSNGRVIGTEESDANPEADACARR